jgi:hypothetical protein
MEKEIDQLIHNDQSRLPEYENSHTAQIAARILPLPI